MQFCLMANSDTYNYPAILNYMEPFKSPFGDTSFITEMVFNYGPLWKFKDCVIGWTFGVSRFKKFQNLRHCKHGSPAFHLWNNNEKVAFIEQHHDDCIVIALEVVDISGRELNHNHPIII